MNRPSVPFVLSAGLLLFGAAGCNLRAPVAAMRPAQLRCEYRENPLGIDLPQPRLSWILLSAQRGEVQTGFQLLAASSPENLAKNQGTK